MYLQISRLYVFRHVAVCPLLADALIIRYITNSRMFIDLIYLLNAEWQKFKSWRHLSEVWRRNIFMYFLNLRYSASFVGYDINISHIFRSSTNIRLSYHLTFRLCVLKTNTYRSICYYQHFQFLCAWLKIRLVLTDVLSWC